MRRLASPLWDLFSQLDAANVARYGVDIRDAGSCLLCTMRIPEVPADRLQVRLAGNVLIVSGDHREETTLRGENMLRTSSSCRHFHRAVPLPCPVSGDLRYEYQPGVLTVSLPKA